MSDFYMRNALVFGIPTLYEDALALVDFTIPADYVAATDLLVHISVSTIVNDVAQPNYLRVWAAAKSDMTSLINIPKNGPFEDALLWAIAPGQTVVTFCAPLADAQADLSSATPVTVTCKVPGLCHNGSDWLAPSTINPIGGLLVVDGDDPSGNPTPSPARPSGLGSWQEIVNGVHGFNAAAITQVGLTHGGFEISLGPTADSSGFEAGDVITLFFQHGAAGASSPAGLPGNQVNVYSIDVETSADHLVSIPLANLKVPRPQPALAGLVQPISSQHDPDYFSQYPWYLFGEPPPPVPSGRVAVVRSYIGAPLPRTASPLAAPVDVPENTSLPTLSGAGVVGQSLSVNVGSWTGNPNGYAIQILRNGDPIEGATSSPYLIVEDDVGQDISAQVIASNGAGPSDPAVSAAVVPTDAAPLAPEFTSDPFITGTGVVGAVLTGHVGTIINNPTSLVYAWLLDDSPITGATSLTYTPVIGDIGTGKIKFQVTASNATAPPAIGVSAAVTITAASSDIPLANNTALYAMLNAGVGASGGKSYILAAGDYGSDSFSNYDYSSAPITIKGQADVLFQSMNWDNCSGIRVGPAINCYGHDATFGSGVRANQSTHLTFDNVTCLTGAPDDTPNPGVGYAFRDAAFITVIGTVGTLTCAGHGSGVAIVTSNHITFQGFGQRNINTDAVILGGSAQITFNQYLVYDMYFNPGDHPDAFQWFPTTGNPTDDLIVTNSMYFQGIGRQAQGFFGEGVGTNHTFDTVAVFGGFAGSFEQSAGVNATWHNCFTQGYGSSSGGNIIGRDGVVNATMTNNISQSAGTYPPEGPYPGFTASGNTTISPAANATDYTQLDIFLAANPLVPARPY